MEDRRGSGTREESEEESETPRVGKKPSGREDEEGSRTFWLADARLPLTRLQAFEFMTESVSIYGRTARSALQHEYRQ